MYRSEWQLERTPFAATPDASQIYPSPALTEALARIEGSVVDAEGEPVGGATLSGPAFGQQTGETDKDGRFQLHEALTFERLKGFADRVAGDVEFGGDLVLEDPFARFVHPADDASADLLEHHHAERWV